MKFCKHCKKFKEIKEFYRRTDRDSYFAWCKGCMDNQRRSVDYPPVSERGSGLIQGK
jgi:hypothetical protein